MKGDFSRDTFDPAKQFSRVLMQQGRVLLDADWNEQTAILLHYLRTLVVDLYGPYWGPASTIGQNGSETKNFQVAFDDATKTLTIGEGHYYVGGLLCENPIEKKWLVNKTDEAAIKLELDNAASQHLLYLDAWEELVTPLDDESLREVALGGADTTVRAKVRWTIRAIKFESPQPATAKDLFNKLITEKYSPARGLLKACAKMASSPTEPCLIHPQSQYRGSENQLYRVEIHAGGAGGTEGTATFKWSRENGSVRVMATVEGNRLQVTNPQGFKVGDWVEVETGVVSDHLKPLLKITAVDTDGLTVDISSNQQLPSSSKVSVRRWDQPAVKVTEGEWLTLDEGINIWFEKPLDGQPKTQYRVGDYWLIPARVATGDVEWPKTDDLSPDDKGCPKGLQLLPSRGVQHYFAPLGVITYSNQQLKQFQTCLHYVPVPEWQCKNV